jgi:hypothetical protein
MQLYHRVIVCESKLDSAITWLTQHNIAFVVEQFGEFFQFVFNENENSDLTCALQFAKVYSVHREVRTYTNKGPVITCSAA